MRAIRTTTISILAVALLAGSAVGVAAQVADPMAPSTFTVQLVGEPVVSNDPGTGTTRLVGEWESTEQRASGTLTQVVASTPVDVADGDGGLVQRLAEQLLTDGGSWVGSSRGFLTFPSDGPETVQFLGELVGEGGYEGLTLLFAETGDTEDVRWLGVIVPSADIPAVPDLPAQ